MTAGTSTATQMAYNDTTAARTGQIRSDPNNISTGSVGGSGYIRIVGHEAKYVRQRAWLQPRVTATTRTAIRTGHRL